MIIDPTKGSAEDWYKGALGTRYSFTIELRGKSGASEYYGFDLPPEEIIPSGEELFAGMRVVFHKLIQDAKGGYIPYKIYCYVSILYSHFTNIFTVGLRDWVAIWIYLLLNRCTNQKMLL